MSAITVVEFENSAHSEEVYLSSELADGPPYTVHGVALGADDVTKGKSGIKKKWPAEELKEAAETLQNTNLVEDHDNSSRGVIGKVTKAGYKEEVGVIYQAELYDEDLADNIEKGMLEVSVRGVHDDVDSLEEDPDTEALVVENIEFKNLSVVPSGAAPSNTLNMGEHDELSAAELASFTEDISETELAEIEPGMWVQGDDVKGITISQVQDGEIEVDVYEEGEEGNWHSIEETQMIPTDDLSEWDVDESDIGPVPEEEDKDSEEENAMILEEGMRFRSTLNSSKLKIVEIMGDVAKIEGEDGSQWNEDVDDIYDKLAREDWEHIGHGEISEEENAATTKDVPTDDAEPQHNAMGAMSGLIGQFMEDGGSEDSSLSDFLEWLESAELSREVEGEDDHLDNKENRRRWLEFDIAYTPSEVEEKLEQSFDDYPEAASENAQMALDAKEETDNPNDCGTDTGWTRANQLASGESLSPTVIKKMSQFNRHRSNSDMDDEQGRADCGWMMWKAWGGDEGVDWASRKVEEEELKGIPEWDEGDEVKWQPMPQMKGKIVHVDTERQVLMVELMDEDRALSGYTVTAGYMDVVPIDEDVEPDDEELQDYEMHEVSFDGTTTQDWSRPTLTQFVSEMGADASEFSDLTEDQQSDIASAFIISEAGFPPEDYGELNLPVVEPSGELNVNALAAVKGGRGVSAVDGLNSDMEDEIVEYVNNLAKEEFDKDWGTEEENAELESMKFSEGDWVMWDWSGSTAHGKVEETFSDEGTVTRTINGNEVSKDSDEQPVYMVKVWDGDGFSSKALRQEGARNLRKWDDHPDEEEMAMKVPEDHRFSSEEDAMAKAEDMGLDGVHEMEFDGDTMYVPGESHDEYMDAVSSNSGHAEDGDMEDEEEMAEGEATDPIKDVAGARVLSGDDLQQVSIGASEADSGYNYKVINMNENIEEKLGELDEPVAVEADELEQLQEKADQFEELSENIEAIRERTELLDEVSREAVEELRDGDDPMVVESARYEELQSEAEQVAGVYAEQLSDHYEAFKADELTDKFSIEELRSKYEDQFGEVEELTASQAEPQSQDPSEEELEEESSGQGSDEEELSDQVSAKQQEIRSKIPEIGGD